jgi:hypothetical protein
MSFSTDTDSQIETTLLRWQKGNDYQRHSYAWLSKLYGKPDNNGTRVLPPESAQARLLCILDDLLSFNTSPQDAAATTASVLLAEDYPPFMNLIGLYLGAAESYEEVNVLQALVDYFVAIASLPDAVNERPEARVLNPLDGWRTRIEPGEVIAVQRGRYWRELPDFNWNLAERFQGAFRFRSFPFSLCELFHRFYSFKRIFPHIFQFFYLIPPRS